MTTTVSTALAALQLRPDDAQALQALKAVHPGNGAGIEADALSKALADARRWHREHADFELCLELIDLELGFTTGDARRADLLHEKGRLLSDELLRDEAGQAAVQQALEAVANHKASAESLAQMTLVRANWEPISRRYLQQAEQAKDPALASSLHGSVAEFYLKYRPTGPEGEAHLRKSLELDAGNRRSAAHLERILRETGRRDELLALYRQRAERAQTREERTAAEVLAGELCEQLGRAPEAFAHFSKALEANPYEPRALRAVRAALTASGAWADLAKVLEAAARTKRGEQDVPLLTELALLFGNRLNRRTWRSRSSAACASSIPPTARWSSSIGPTTPRGTSCRSSWRCWRRPRRPRRTSIAASRWASRWRAPPSSGRRTPTRRSRYGRASCACGRTCPRPWRRCASSTRRPRSGTRCSSSSRRSSTRCRPRTSTRRSTASWRSWPSTAIG